jgi:hypothetical protein
MFNQNCQSNTNMSCDCNMNSMSNCNNNCSQNTMGCGCFNGCPRPQPIVANKRVCVSQQVTPVPQPIICPIECRRVNRCMYYPVYYPRYEQTFVNMPY